MLAAFLITFREGLEMALVVAILLAYLDRTEQRKLWAPVWAGVGSALVAVLAIGVPVYLAVGGLEGRLEKAIEAVAALVAVVVLTWMIFWMRKQASTLARRLEDRIQRAVEASLAAVWAVAFSVVAREGLEAVLFLLGARAGGVEGAPVVAGGLAGLAGAAFVGWSFYRGGRKLPLRSLFTVTGALLILFAAGLVGKAVHEIFEFLELEGGIARPVWTITTGPLSGGFLKDLLASLFGWSSQPEAGRVLAYLAYLLPVASLYFGVLRPLEFRRVPGEGQKVS
jgi:high-affinity iron transporter